MPPLEKTLYHIFERRYFDPVIRWIRNKTNEMIAIGCDHGGFHLKQQIISHLKSTARIYHDFGSYDTNSCDYPDFAQKVCQAVLSKEYQTGILICGTGIGISIAANKIAGIRAAVCDNTFCAKYSRLHNDANILALGERVIGLGLALDIVELFLNTNFEGGRHTQRVEKIHKLEQK